MTELTSSASVPEQPEMPLMESNVLKPRNFFFNFAPIFGLLLPMTGIARADSVKSLQVPIKQQLPITPESFCVGLANVAKRQKQSAEKELGQLCSGPTPTPLLLQLIQSPYTGGANYQFRTIALGPIAGSDYVGVNVAYSMRIKKSALDLILGEEGMIKDPGYANGDGSPALNVQFKLLPPDLSQPLMRENEADTAFNVTQRSKRASGQRQFDNLSLHNLRLYRMNKNNYDFMASIRSLANPAVDGKDAIFRRAIVVRATMVDPNDNSMGLSLTLMNFEVSDQRGQADKVEDVFAEYISRDIKAVYQYHTKNK